MRSNEHFFLKNTIKNIPETFNSINDYLYLSNIYISIQERLYFKLKQINSDEYNWIDNELLNQCIERLEKMIVENNEYIPSFEKTLIHNSNESLHENIDRILKPHFTENILFRFSAIIDVFSENSIWELKFTNQISIEHKIQLVIYAWIYQSMNLPSRDFKLFNIKTGELYILNSNFDDGNDKYRVFKNNWLILGTNNRGKYLIKHKEDNSIKPFSISSWKVNEIKN